MLGKQKEQLFNHRRLGIGRLVLVFDKLSCFSTYLTENCDRFRQLKEEEKKKSSKALSAAQEQISVSASDSEDETEESDSKVYLDILTVYIKRV